MNHAFKLNNGSILLVVESPGGLYNGEQLRVIAELASKSEVAMVRALEDQRIGFVLAEEKVELVSDTLSEVGLSVRHYQNSLHQPLACMGASCPKATQDALGAAMELSGRLADIEIAESLKIGINGCATSCVPTHSLDISIVGETNGYRISLGGKTSLFPEFATFIAQGVPEKELSAAIEKVVGIYQSHKEPGEGLHDLMERIGISLFIEALHPYSRDAGAQNLDLSLPEESSSEEDGLQDEDQFNFDDIPYVDDLEELSEPLESDIENASPEVLEGVDLDSLPTDIELEDSDGLSGEESEDIVMDEDLSLESLEPEHIEVEAESIDLSGVVDQAHTEDEGQDLLDDMNMNEDIVITDDVEIESDLEDAEELSEDDAVDEYVEEETDEEDLEAKITQSIAEESLISYDDKSDKQRMQAVQMVELIADSEQISEPDDVENHFSSEEVLGDFEDNLGGDLNYEEGVSHPQNGFTIQSVNQDGPRVVINFSTGASVSIDIDQLKSMSGRMELVLNKQKVSLVETDGTIILKAGGIEFKLPSQAAA